MSNPAPRLRSAKRAPTRIDLGGGWTDVPPYSGREGGFVTNIAIARYATVRVERLADEGGAEICGEREVVSPLVNAAARRAALSGVRAELQNDFPLGAGLGGSSSAGVALAAAFAELTGERLDRAELAERSRETETGYLGIAGGGQDHYAAAFGGALGLRFNDTVEVTQLPLSSLFCEEFEQRALLIYTGESRISGETITAVMDAYCAGDTRVTSALARMKALAEEMSKAVLRADVDELAALIREHWVHQRALHRAIPTARIDAIIAHAQQAGAMGAKALGASGGGCVLVLSARDNTEDVRRAIAHLGEFVPFTIDERGVHEADATGSPSDYEVAS